MGTIFYIYCKDCDVYRDLDKFSALCQCSGRKDLRSWMKREPAVNIRERLLTEFVVKHKCHNIVFFDENDDAACDEAGVWNCLDDKASTKEEIDFWTPTDEET